MTLPETQSHTFAGLDELAAAFPDLEPFARELLTKVPPGASAAGFRVDVWAQGAGVIGAYENASVMLRLSPDPGASPPRLRSIGRAVLMRGQVWTLDKLLQLVAEGDVHLSGEVARAAYDRASFHAGKVEKFKATFADRPPPEARWPEFFGILLGTLDHAYRAGRAMREAELGEAAEPHLQKALQVKQLQQIGQAASAKHKSDRTRRDVKLMADDKMRHGPPPGQTKWERPELAFHVREGWPNEEERPSIKTITRYLKQLGLP